MPLMLRDYRCDVCGHTEEQLLYEDEYAKCSECGGAMGIIYLKAPAIDCYGSEQWDQHNEISFTSEREREKKMKEKGFERSPSADKDHGARNESHLNLGKTFSYKGERCN